MKYDLTSKITEIGLAAPAVRALNHAGYVRLSQLAGESNARIEQLHGMGPNALAQIRLALAACGMALEGESLPVPKSGKYVQVGDLKMYCEIHGHGKPLVMLHGGMLQGGVFSTLVPILAENRQVITIDQQAHGRTADIARPLRFEQMADDTAALLDKIGIKQADFFGYSEGGVVAMELAIRHPQLVHKLALGSTIFNLDGYHGPVKSGMQSMTAKIVPKRMRLYYQAVAPNPNKWSELVEKSAELARTWKGIPPKSLKSIRTQTLVFMADKDYVREEHGAELAKLLNGEFLVLSKSTHMSYLFKPNKLLIRILPFLNASAAKS